MANYEHVGKGAVVVRFYPTLRIFVIRFLDANVAVDNVFFNFVVRFLGILRSLPLRLIHLQVSDRLDLQDTLRILRTDEAEVPVVAHHPLLEFSLVRRAPNDPVHFID